MKQRLDILVVAKGLASSRQQAQGYIMAGQIFVNGRREDKPGASFEEDSILEFHGKTLPYVSRGGLKLEKALQVFPLELTDKVCLDIGASTGGFTDCMLQNGARKVYAVDVGYGQLAYKLRTDPRVVCMEKTNVRYLTTDKLAEPGDFASVDVSFISLKLVLPPLIALLTEEAELVCLVKPQFEAGREKVGKKGVVRDKAVHREVLETTCAAALALGLVIRGLDYSPVKGPEGNIEYLLYLSKNKEGEGMSDDALAAAVSRVVSDSHAALDKEPENV